MHVTSVPLLLLAAGTVGFLHSILPDHWVPLAVVARTRKWSLVRTARISMLASIGHVVTSILLAGVIALVGLQFRSEFAQQQAHIVGAILVATGIGFVVWSILGGHHEHEHEHDHFIPGDTEGAARASEHVSHSNRSVASRMTAIAVPFGAAASPDLTVLPVALGASGIGLPAVGGVLVTFSLVTLATFVVLTVSATAAGYQVKGEWLEERGMLLTGLVLGAIGVAVYAGL